MRTWTMPSRWSNGVRGEVEGLAPDRLDVVIRRDVGAPMDPEDPSGGLRTVLVRPVGSRWAGLQLGPQ